LRKSLKTDSYQPGSLGNDVIVYAIFLYSARRWLFLASEKMLVIECLRYLVRISTYKTINSRCFNWYEAWACWSYTNSHRRVGG